MVKAFAAPAAAVKSPAAQSLKQDVFADRTTALLIFGRHSPF
tara:strand:+ start:10310 stop:10435 length:126 start_codon:yes stop_codon:yes gene_type:complete